MTSQFEFRESLEDMSLSEMFANIHRHKVPGLFEISREGVTKRIHIREGFVFHATSTDPADRLGALLYRQGKLARQDLEETLEAQKDLDLRIGQVLVERELIAPDELYRAIRDQTEVIVWSVFSWQTGEVTFRIGEFDQPMMIKIHLPIRQVIVQGVKKVPDARPLVSRLGKKSSVFKPIYCAEDLVEVALNADEYRLLRLIDGQRSLYEVCTMGPFGVSENARLLYAFNILRLIERLPDESGSSGIMLRMQTDGSVADSSAGPATGDTTTKEQG